MARQPRFKVASKTSASGEKQIWFFDMRNYFNVSFLKVKEGLTNAFTPQFGRDDPVKITRKK